MEHQMVRGVLNNLVITIVARCTPSVRESTATVIAVEGSDSTTET